MNAPLNPDFAAYSEPLRDSTASDIRARSRNRALPLNLRDRVRLLRTPIRTLSLRRMVRGGRLNDVGRLPRYALLVGLVLSAIWIPIGLYLGLAAPTYMSSVSLILPGTGVSSSVNLSEIGQASTSANSPYSSSSISPTVTYQKLVQSQRVVGLAAQNARIPNDVFGRPRVKLVDQTSLMEIQMKGASPDEAKAKAEAMLAAFLSELDALRDDEMARRESSVTGTVKKYQDAVNAIRDRISALQIETGLSSTDQFSGIVQRNEELMANIAEGQAELDRVGTSVDSLSSLLGISSESAALTIKLQADPEYAAHSAALSELSAKLAELGNLYGPHHPEVTDARKRHIGTRLKMLDRAMLVTGLGMEELQTELERAASGERGALLAKLVSETAKRDGLTARLAVLRDKLAGNQARLVDLTEAASRLDRLNRDYKVAEAVFTSALARLNVSKTDIFASYPMVQIAEPPSLPWKPSSPNTILAIVAGIMATFCAVVGLVLFWVRRPLIDKLTGARTPFSEAPDAQA